MNENWSDEVEVPVRRRRISRCHAAGLAAGVLLLALLCMAGSRAEAARYYVKEGGIGDGQGSWNAASGNLKAILDSVGPGDEIWVTKGTYRPHPDSPDESFVLKEGVKLYGGFAGGETDLSQRNRVANVTILTGDLAGDDEDRDENGVTVSADRIVGTNSKTVVKSIGCTAAAILDGFSICGGSRDNGHGSGMRNENSSPTVTRCSFLGNRAGVYGGGMYNKNGSPAVNDCIFSGNGANRGGGMYNVDNSAPTVTGCTFSYNRADFNGGGMYNKNSSPTLTGCTFSKNGAGHFGGGLYSVNSSLTVNQCAFSGNGTGINGGGMYNKNSSPTVYQCSFLGNNANDNGGGMLNYYNSFPTVNQCIFSGNSAGRGGGVYNFNYSSPTLINCTFSENSAGFNGGGLFNRDSSPTLTNCTFSRNRAAINGGGLYNINDSNPTVTNCTFSENTAAGSGGGLFNRGSSPILTNCTFSENSSDKSGSGMHNVDRSSPTLAQCILWDKGPIEIHGDGSSNPIIAYCIVKGWMGGGKGNIPEDPKLAGLADNGGPTQTCALGRGSPAIDAGLNAGTHIIGNISVVVPDKDQRGLDRPQGVSVDIGAYEELQNPGNKPKPDPGSEPKPEPGPKPEPEPKPEPKPSPDPLPNRPSDSSGGGCNAGWGIVTLIAFGATFLRGCGAEVPRKPFRRETYGRGKARE